MHMAAVSPAAKVDNESLATRQVARHRVRLSLQSMILRGELPPGSRLLQLQLAKQLGVAQGVVREALLELQACGLVETVDNRGVYVSQLNSTKLVEAFEVREMHEGLAVRLCCDRVRRADVRALRELAMAAFDAGRGNLQEAGAKDRALHESIAQLCGNSMLIRLAENYRLFGKIVQVNRDPRTVRDEHFGILDAIEAGDGDRAEALMRAHIRAAKEALMKLLSERQFDLNWLVS